MKQFITLFLSVFILSSYAGPSFAANEFEFIGLKKSKGVVSSFSEITAGGRDKGIAFSLNLISPAHVTILYAHNGKEKIILNNNYDVATQIKFPESDKYIYLEKSGMHKFTASVKIKDKVISNTLSIIVENKLISKISSVKNNKFDFDNGFKEGEALNFSDINLISTLAFSGPKKIIAEKSRGAGTKLFKNLADSIVLIATNDSIGTGTVINKNGTILTNWHVIQGYKSVAVIFRPPNFQEVESGERYIADVIKINETKDLALIKIRDVSRELIPVKLGNQKDVEIAMDVHAIGHPKGNFWTYTKGVLSQIRPRFNWRGKDKIPHTADVIQTQTPINPGNSGGPLLTSKELLIGVNSFIDADAQGLNFAVAITSVREFIESDSKIVRAQPVKTDNKDSFVRIDADKDGYEEMWVSDTNDNGVPDLFKIDEDMDNEPDVLLIDKNENGIPEIIVRSVIKDGNEILVFAVDNDEDGEVDAYGYDFDLDGEIDKVVPA